MDMHTPIDVYCERLDASFWAEPLNAISNSAFVIAALVAWRRGRSKVGFCGLAPYMVGLVAIIGLGSFLFHTIATRWAALADVVPIAVYIHVFFALAMRRMFDLTKGHALGLSLAFLLLSFALIQLLGRLDWIGSSAGYAPALAALWGVGGLLLARQHPAGTALLSAGAVFLMSLIFRTLDAPLCSALPLGIHFIWHCLNALVLYITLHALLSTAPPSRA